MICDGTRAIHTIGHSTRSADAFIALLKAHTVQLLVDVRRWPASRRYPHFNREILADDLKGSGIDYLWRGDLGGYRKPSPESPNTAWRVGAFRAYADFMLTEDFARIMREVEETAAASRIALMCAEAVPWRCHRQLLADAFIVRGWSVRHIMDDGCREHRLPDFANVKEDTQIFYSGGKKNGDWLLLSPGSATGIITRFFLSAVVVGMVG
jgi:uncharacterized protein (DUF488 family)